MLKIVKRIRKTAVLALVMMGPILARAQATADSVSPLLEKPVQPTSVTAYQLQKYLMKRIRRPVVPEAAEEWSVQEQKVRKEILQNIVFHGWPKNWITSPPRFEQTEVMETNHGYRLRKFNYEIVPGLWSTAILYEPDSIKGRVPAILNVVGHEPQGNLVEYEQKRCINFAKQGMIALSLGWLGYGEHGQQENNHDFGGHLDLVGSNLLGYFYLEMRRGLDYLASLPEADPTRLGVTGLSGGGWQTTILSALDERVAASAEVAGIGSWESNLARPTDTAEIEEDATDLVQGRDYSLFVALRAPRPTLLMHNAQDDCCFLSSLVKPYIYDHVIPFFKLYAAEQAFLWHENIDPGTHNYQLDNRQTAYAFFSEQFHLPPITKEIASEGEIHSMSELAGHLPKDNLTVAGLARKLGGQINRPPMPSGGKQRDSWINTQREQLKSTIRLPTVSLDGSWRLVSTRRPGLQSLSYRFDFSDGLSATGIWVASSTATQNAPVTIVIKDKGFRTSAQTVADRVNRGEQVLALEPLFFGSTAPDDPDPSYWEMLDASGGDRPLGMEVSQFLTVAKSFHAASEQKIRVETEGIRSQVVALIAAALDPELFSEIHSDGIMDTLRFLLDAPVPYRSAPDLFCLDLYKYVDIDTLTAMAAPVQFTLGNKAVAPPLPARNW